MVRDHPLDEEGQEKTAAGGEQPANWITGQHCRRGHRHEVEKICTPMSYMHFLSLFFWGLVKTVTISHFELLLDGLCLLFLVTNGLTS